MQPERALISEGRATAAQNTRLLSGHCLGQVGIARHMLELIAGNNDVPREIDDLSTHQGWCVSLGWRGHERRRVVMLSCPVDQQGTLVVDSNYDEFLTMPCRPLFRGSDTNTIPNAPEVVCERYTLLSMSSGTEEKCIEIYTLPILTNP